jgi:molybdate-binding protein/DNA-binding PadR family transcriptional regulator
MPIAHALLTLLTDGERCGYDLRRDLETELGAGWRLDFGQLYRVLAGMRRNGWIRGRAAPGLGGPRRRMYVLTEAGRRELSRWRPLPARIVRGRDELPVKLLGAPPREAARLLRQRRLDLHARRTDEGESARVAQRARALTRWWVADTARRQVEASLTALDHWPTPQAAGRPAAGPDALVLAGSDDLLLDLVSACFASAHPDRRLVRKAVGSLGGLIALSEGRAAMAGIHLLDIESGDYNVPFVTRLVPEEPVVLVNLARREQGLLMAPGNPRDIRRLSDLTKRRCRLVNRQHGAGTRLRLFHALRRAGVEPHALRGYDAELPTHAAVAAAIAAGHADAGPGIRAAAAAWQLDFLPLGEERFDLAIPRRLLEKPMVQSFLDLLHQRDLRREAGTLPGYDISRMGEIVTALR